MGITDVLPYALLLLLVAALIFRDIRRTDLEEQRLEQEGEHFAAWEQERGAGL